MTWIRVIPDAEAEGKLRGLYDRIRNRDGNIDNIMQAHSLRPHTMEGHMALYKRVLHHRDNRLPAWLRETLGLYVSLLNRCPYCVEHHYAGLRRLLGDGARAQAMRSALEDGDPQRVFEGPELALMRYAESLTLEPAGLGEATIALLRDSGVSDGEILEANQIVSYFAYANRTVLGLGVDSEGDVLGLSPSNADDADDWSHR